MPREDWIRQYDDLMEAIADPFKSGIAVYHYTSAEGFRGIVENSEIWLTNTAFVNDTTECRAFWDLTRDQVLGSGPFPNRHVEKCWEWMRKYGRVDHLYVASFSKVRDSLEQFRAYGSFCLGLDASKLGKPGFYLHDCVYDTSAIKDWILRKSRLEQWEGDHLEGAAKDGGAHNLLFAAAVKYKSAYYEAEEEVRLISVSNHDLRDGNTRQVTENQPPVHFRDHHAYRLSVPYVKFFLTDHTDEDDVSDLPFRETPMETRMRRSEKERRQSRGLLPITEVRIGPMMHQKEARIACEMLLQTAGYEHVKVEALDIPYRGR